MSLPLQFVVVEQRGVEPQPKSLSEISGQPDRPARCNLIS